MERTRRLRLKSGPSCLTSCVTLGRFFPSLGLGSHVPRMEEIVCGEAPPGMHQELVRALTAAPLPSAL